MNTRGNTWLGELPYTLPLQAISVHFYVLFPLTHYHPKKDFFFCNGYVRETKGIGFHIFYRLQQKSAQYSKSAQSPLFIYATVLNIIFHFCGVYDLFQLTALFFHHDTVFRVL